jgi:N-acetylmuramoyl-L-alanine amidase
MMTPSTQPSPQLTQASSPLAGVTVVVDAGHNRGNFGHTKEIARQVPDGKGGSKPCNTTGTQTDDGYREAEYTWDVSQRLVALLRQAGANVVTTVRADTPWGPCVDQRAKIGNDAHAAAVVSIHADGGPAGKRGFHVMEPGLSGPNKEPSHRLAAAVRDAYRSGSPMPVSNYIGVDGLNPRTDMAGLNLSQVPAVMLESGNMRNATDAALMGDASFRQTLAAALVTALRNFVSSR